MGKGRGRADRGLRFTGFPRPRRVALGAVGLVLTGFLLFVSSLAQQPDKKAGDGGQKEAQEFAISQVSVHLPKMAAYIDVLDSAGNPVSEVAAGRLSATLGRDPVTVSSLKPFEQSGEGVGYVFLVDVSRSLAPSVFAQLRLALDSWVRDLKERDRAAIIKFGEDIKLVQDFTADKGTLNADIESLGPSDNKTQLHGAIARALEMAKRDDPGLPLRRVIVVMTDGKDEGSGMAVEDVLDKIRQDRMPIYAIGYSNLPGSEKQQYLDVLHRFSRASGGGFREAGTTPLSDIYEGMKRTINRVFVADMECASCRAEGQTERLQINLNLGGKAFTDGVDVALIPAANGAPSPSPASSPLRTAVAPPVTAPVSFWKRIPKWAYAAGAVLVILIAVLVVGLISRARKRRVLAVQQAERKESAQEFRQPATPAPAATHQTPPLEGFPVRLTTIGGSHRGQVYDLSISRVAVIGRNPDCDIAIPDDAELSGRHCQLAVSNGRVVIFDLQSTNGTVVNGVPVRDRHRLENGDKVLVGETEFRVSFEEMR
ncbi:MAG TPA: FHA domain-containing protein [Blastocatellia bacterium]|nr:FHA domain-containing protein [Blastocatellia bacterium]